MEKEMDRFKRNLKILEENNVCACNTEPVWEDYPDSVELESYTEAGGDMLICLIEPTRDCLQEYIDDFDIDNEVMIWWQDGRDAAHAKGVPFTNIREHYEDLEDWLHRLQEVCNLLD